MSEVAQDYSKAREFAQGSTNAMPNLGRLYDYGRGVAQDYAKAREWYQNRQRRRGRERHD